MKRKKNKKIKIFQFQIELNFLLPTKKHSKIAEEIFFVAVMIEEKSSNK